MKKFNGFLDFGHCAWDSERAMRLYNTLLTYIFDDEIENDHKVAVRIEKVADDGFILLSEIHIFNSYIDALRLINKNEYSNNIYVEVYEIKKYTSMSLEVQYTYVHMLYKIYDSSNYARLAQPEESKIEINILRKWFDKQTIFYIYER